MYSCMGPDTSSNRMNDSFPILRLFSSRPATRISLHPGMTSATATCSPFATPLRPRDRMAEKSCTEV